jgi:hypothetical protein
MNKPVNLIEVLEERLLRLELLVAALQRRLAKLEATT